jgi:hypothetical protein
MVGDGSLPKSGLPVNANPGQRDSPQLLNLWIKVVAIFTASNCDAVLPGS